ncbi:1-deoxy-D-xylulose 5-phosphate reductoisomerase,1-deoxy-D-xylulose 5-phosphate reductoisomerase,Translation elongation factor Ts,1-deoxy-D-xylulose 5-phosphate reductoisomerase,1-deoxy-D-xylulose 5-phosphate reductoisomerase C-terminal [Chlamydia serpentis]|uniref:1-deoxy-D-xylulose 5-phosphate reductoisomerase n=1 Tax=Chlamydia serpentis TaxID=1967782 RepID=A0A2R8FAN7_9CHLA|nr:1-deoxy-D-xylulose-5-phosphate reductoisomerase [Chlamydia serpentis]SPN73485.1 1-deoxy-D-xylulose 5-phosphate reductoisomerase,1-deoxy-D-xylulose 5-phosphate reductoisomerase,Translation elongation factor Ts,1-deoxy-D-xylulose 5-phosphate reductoisomerase,1-deoxy-D-xylulose 5-phosphate reductoisomerase C-terminal [Chlamydia serpentis]
MKHLAVLGSTGSIGRQTLEIVRRYPSKFKIIAMASYGNNSRLFFEQLEEFSPLAAAVYHEDVYKEACRRFSGIQFFLGQEGLIQLCVMDAVSMVVAASSGIEALPAILEAIKKRKMLALANKEILVCAGKLVSETAKQYNTQILPIDSEHNALYQCLEGRASEGIKKLVLTASGGPLFNKSLEELNRVTKQDILNHPIWNMGAKITVDSSTLVNKGLEIIEAYWLFDLKNIEITAVIHPQSLIHGMVELQDGSVISIMNPPDMLFPIQYALTAPERFPSPREGMDFSKKHTLDFFPIDEERFPSIRLARQVLEYQGSAGSFFNAANEILVHRFLSDEISWCDILQKLTTLMESHKVYACHSLEDILEVDGEARALAQEI